MIFKYATIAIPANTPIKRAGDHSETKFVIPVSVQAKIPAYRDGRTRGGRSAVWIFTQHGLPFYLEQSQESAVSITDVEVKGKA